MYDYRMGRYKRTKKKKYTIYCCMPPLGTKVYNLLEGTYYITTAQASFVLSGTVGEKWVIPVDKLAKIFNFADGTPITPNSLIAKFKIMNGKRVIDWFAIESKVSMDTPIVWACQIPANIQTHVPHNKGNAYLVNKKGVPHSTGDFVICADKDGKPYFENAYVVNGEIFSDTYDLSNFKEVRKAGYLPKKGIPMGLFKGFNGTLS